MADLLTISLALGVVRPLLCRAVMISASLMGKIVADEAACLFRRARVRTMAAMPWPRVVDELGRTEEVLSRRGFLDNPIGYHRTPSAPRDVRTIHRHARRTEFEHVEFASQYEPRHDPGRTRWLSYEPCRTMHASILRCEKGEGRPWLICIPGYGMGQPAIDFSAFQVAALQEHLQINIAVPVLPLHGVRSVGWLSGDGYFAGDCLDTLNAQTQAVWDIRRLIAWIRAQGGETIGLYGLSLGGYTAALLVALERNLACVIAGIPASDFIGLGRLHLPAAMQQLACSIGLDWQRVERVYRVISPLAMEPQIAWERRNIFGATADRIVPLSQVRQLWRHWKRPRSCWYRGSHLSFLAEARVQTWVRQALEQHLASGARVTVAA